MKINSLGKTSDTFNREPTHLIVKRQRRLIGPPLLDRHRLREVARLIDIGTAKHRNMVRQQL